MELQPVSVTKTKRQTNQSQMALNRSAASSATIKTPKKAPNGLTEGYLAASGIATEDVSAYKLSNSLRTSLDSMGSIKIEKAVKVAKGSGASDLQPSGVVAKRQNPKPKPKPTKQKPKTTASAVGKRQWKHTEFTHR
ncbi:hypothetical protein AAHH84_00075 [Candidatus Hodgkinia cicadicola]